MSLTPQELFSNLKTGDLLMIPASLPSDKGRQITLLSAVLRTGDDGALYLSQPDEHRALSRAYADLNPFRWDPKKGALVDRDGDVPRWYTVDIALERGGAKESAAKYAAVPRLEHMRPEHVIDDLAFKRFVEKDPLAGQLDGIITNGEAGSPMYQLALALDAMGIGYTRDQAMGLAYFMERFHGRNRMVATLIAIGDRDAGEAAAAAGSSPKKT